MIRNGSDRSPVRSTTVRLTVSEMEALDQAADRVELWRADLLRGALGAVVRGLQVGSVDPLAIKRVEPVAGEAKVVTVAVLQGVLDDLAPYSDEHGITRGQAVRYGLRHVLATIEAQGGLFWPVEIRQER